MGMTCSLYRAGEDEIDRLVEQPEALRAFLDLDEVGALPVQTVRFRGVAGFILRLLPITITEVAPAPADGPPAAGAVSDRSVDLDKSWHGLHYLFTASADGGEEPACYLLRGGEDLDDDGEARALRPADVRRFAEFLAGLTTEELARRYDPARMTTLEIYPESIWMRSAPPGESPLDWLLQSFSELRQFVDRIAASNDAVVIYVA